ncbi:FadR/GntR family transcriptional regulator [Telmatospirillum sp. J64-1]|uniref:FadR/GntR family transcriptional regulator n=1 Tax=Telmatospirillum sp. J64-1 TaxID=2502183 RepID=UPI00115DF31A|nr:FadR/GntR family transcriptional regulator [Telmatospirillum sp. J64-1]
MAELKLQPRKRERLGDQLYGQILEQIVSGALKEGQRLPSEKEICQSFQVSRPVVREALMRLQADGLVVSRQGAGSFVQRRPPEGLIRFADASDVAGLLRCVEIRLALEGEAAALAAQRRTPQQLAAIQAAMEDFVVQFKAGNAPNRADLAFHRAIADASGNQMFGLMLDSIHKIVEGAMAVALNLTREGSEERAKRVFEEHRAIYDAIAAGDSEAARLAMRLHLGRARQRVTDHQRDK